MHFVMAGKPHELNFETVVEAASQIVSDSLDGRHKYFVAVRGLRFPVKQLEFSQATGRGRNEFITHEAIRNLRKLGFSVEDFDSPRGLTPRLANTVVLEEDVTAETASFAVSLEEDEDGYIVAGCPQLPGCHSQGRSKQEAIDNIEEAIRGYVASMKRHGEEIPIVDWAVVKADALWASPRDQPSVGLCR